MGFKPYSYGGDINMKATALTERQEKFCQILAREALDPAEACCRAGFVGGYGVKDKTKRNAYHSLMANRLLKKEAVMLRINEIKEEILAEDKGYQANMIQRLKRMISFNPLKYYESTNILDDKTGYTKTNIYLKTQVQDWDAEDGAMVAGFDKNGMPRFIDKQWAFEKLLKIYSLDGSRQVDVEDLMALFLGAGLPVNDPQMNAFSMATAELDDDDDLEALEKMVDEDIDADNSTEGYSSEDLEKDFNTDMNSLIENGMLPEIKEAS